MSITFTSEITSAATSHVLNTLSTLYTNPPFAVLREFVANGIDAHTDAGYDGPVEVTLPDIRDAHGPKVVITDHGKGMSRDTLVNVYYNYGESTKRDAPDRIGAFGLGSKSAYAVSPTWELVSVTSTSVIHVVSSINSDGMPEHRMSETPNTTNAATGVVVTIPLGAGTATRPFIDEAVKLCTWLPKGSVELRNLTPIHVEKAKAHWTDNTVRFGKLAFTKGYRARDAQVVMGGIPYRADLRQAYTHALDHLFHERESILTVFGSVSRATFLRVLSEADVIAVLDDPRALDVTTARDDVKMTPRSVDALSSVFAEEVTRVIRFLSTSDGSMASLESVKDSPMVGLTIESMHSRRELSEHPTALIPYERRNSTLLTSVTDFTMYRNLLWHRFSPLPALVITNYPENSPTIPLVDKLACGIFKVSRDHIYVSHSPDTGRAALDVGEDVLQRNHVRFITWEDYSARAKEMRRAARRENPPTVQPVEGLVLCDHKVVETFSLQLNKVPGLFAKYEGVPAYFTSLWSNDTEEILKTLPRGFTGILVRTLLDTRRDNLLSKRYGILSTNALSSLSVNDRNISAVRALSPKQRKAVLDHLDIESRSGVDCATVNTIYAYHENNGKPLAGTAFVKSIESCELGRRIIASRDSGFRRYSMNNEEILSALRKDSDRFYARYPLITALNLSRGTSHPDAMAAVIQYIKTVDDE